MKKRSHLLSGSMGSEKRTEKQRKSDGNLKGVRFIFIPRFPSFFFLLALGLCLSCVCRLLLFGLLLGSLDPGILGILWPIHSAPLFGLCVCE